MLYSFRENNIDSLLNEDQYICCDLGFTGKKMIKKIENPQDDEEIEFDFSFQQIRIKIENTFTRLKKFQMLTQKMNFKYKEAFSCLTSHRKIWKSVIYIFNKFLFIRNDTLNKKINEN